MSRYKELLIAHLKTVDLQGERILSIGSQEDDRRYFRSTQYEEWVTLDSDQRFKPGIAMDMNKPIMADDGEVMLDISYCESFDIVLALNLWEYIWNPIVGHENIGYLLKSKGLLVTNYPFIYPMHNPVGMDFMRFTPDGARKLLSLAGFQIIEETPILGNRTLVQFYQEDGMKMRANEEHRTIGTIIQALKI
jgi:hypothetical protein